MTGILYILQSKLHLYILKLLNTYTVSIKDNNINENLKTYNSCLAPVTYPRYNYQI